MTLVWVIFESLVISIGAWVISSFENSDSSYDSLKLTRYYNSPIALYDCHFSGPRLYHRPISMPVRTLYQQELEVWWRFWLLGSERWERLWWVMRDSTGCYLWSFPGGFSKNMILIYIQTFSLNIHPGLDFKGTEQQRNMSA